MEILSLTPQSWLLILAGLLGMIFGSFLNVCILRIPEEKGIGGRSACPKCHYQLSWYDNIPVLSYLFLRGKCRKCSLKISPIYPFVELLTGILAICTLIHENYDLIKFLVWFLVFICPLIVIIFIDFKHQIIPDVISLPGIPIGILASLYLYWPNWWESLQYSGIGLLAGGGSLFLLGTGYYLLTKKEGMGGGDVKLAAALGTLFGGFGMLFIFLSSSVLALIYAIITAPLQQRSEGSIVIPFGPFLAGGSLLLYFFGNDIMNYYFQISGLHFSDIYPF